MKRLFGFVIVMTLGVFIMIWLSQNVFFPTFGEIDLTQRVALRYINRDVVNIIYGITSNLESGAANIVTSIVADYRSFDTLGEVTVLFISAIGVSILFASNTLRMTYPFKTNFMLKEGSKWLVGIIMVTGFFMITHGHLTPGGGFPGGVMLASGMLLMYLADDTFQVKLKSLKWLESFAGAMYILLGLLGLIVLGSFLQNILPNGIIGELLSAGMIPIVYVLIGLKVGSEIGSMLDHFMSEEVSQ